MTLINYGGGLILFKSKGENTMYTRTIKYTDYNGVEREEKFSFNLTKAEIMEMEMSEVGGLTETINRIVAAQDAPQLIKLFKDLILRAYGEKSADGKRFIKNDEIKEAFSQTEAYSILFMELAQDADKASEFVNGIIPADLSKELQKSSLPEKLNK